MTAIDSIDADPAPDEREPLSSGGGSPGRAHVFLVLRLCAAAGILAYLFYRIPVSDVIAAMGEIGPLAIGGALVAALLVAVVISYRLCLLLNDQGRPYSFSFREVFAVNLTAEFYGLFLPGGSLSKSAVRIYRLGRPASGSAAPGGFAGAGAAVAADRVAATLALAPTGLCFWFLDSPADSGFAAIAMLLAAGVALAAYLLLFRQDLLRRGRTRERPRARGIRGWIRRLVPAVPVAFRRVGELPGHSVARAMALSVLAHLLTIVLYVMLAFGLGMEVSVARLGWIVPAVTALTMLPLAPAALGVREAGLVLLLQPFGVPGETALALSLLAFGIIVVRGLLGGALELYRSLTAARPAMRIRVEATDET